MSYDLDFGKHYATDPGRSDHYMPWHQPIAKQNPQRRLHKERVIKVISPKVSQKTPTSQLLALAPSHDEFKTLSRQWHDDTLHLSSVSEMTSHPAYQKILAMGIFAIPWILEDLQETNAFWFPALRFITRKNPAEGKEGQIRAMTEAWVNWAKKQKII